MESDFSAIIPIVLVIISFIIKAVNKARDKEGNSQANQKRQSGFASQNNPRQAPQIPYVPSGAQDRRPSWDGIDTFHAILDSLEIDLPSMGQTSDAEGSSAQEQAFEPIEAEPIPEIYMEGSASSEGEPEELHARHMSQRMAEPEPRSNRASGYFANGEELRRAVVMSEILAKPVSLRKRKYG